MGQAPYPRLLRTIEISEQQVELSLSAGTDGTVPELVSFFEHLSGKRPRARQVSS